MKNHRVEAERWNSKAPGEWSWLLAFCEVWLCFILVFSTWGIGWYDLFPPSPLPTHPPLPGASVFSVLPSPRLGQGPASLLPWHRVQRWHKEKHGALWWFPNLFSLLDCNHCEGKSWPPVHCHSSRVQRGVWNLESLTKYLQKEIQKKKMEKRV